MSIEKPTDAELRINQDRTRKAVEKLNDKNSAHGSRRYTAFAQVGQPSLIVLETRPYKSRDNTAFAEAVRYQTGLEQRIGIPVTYANRYSETNRGTMCKGIEMMEEARRRSLDNLRDLEQQLRRQKEDVAHTEASIARITAELGL